MKRKFFKKTLVLTSILIMSLSSVLAGCSNASKGSTENLSVCDGPQPETIDPALNVSVDGATLINHGFEGLMKIDSTGAIVKGMAKDYKISDDGKVYTFTLRDDAKWSDGQALVAEDFVYSWQRAVDPATAAEYAYMIDMVVNTNEIMAGEKDKSELGIKAIDEKTIEITLVTETPFFLEICAFPTTYPVRKDVVEANPDGWSKDPSTYIGNGPYKLTEWTDLDKMVYTQNENYYDVKNLGPKTITFQLMEDNNTILSAFKNGQILFGDDLPSAEIEAMTGNGLYTEGQLGTYFLCVNMNDPVFQDVRVRKALALAIDREYIVKNVSKAGEVPATSFVSIGLSDVKMDEEFQAKATPWFGTDYEANLAEAKQLLADAGYPNGEGFPTVEYLFNPTSIHPVLAEALQNMWKTGLGINATLSSQDWAVFIQTRQDGEYQIARHGWLADYNDPISFIDMFVTGGGNNDADYSNPDYDALVAQVKASSDRGERITLMHQAEDILAKDMPIIPIFYYTDLYLKSDKLEGFYSSPLGYKYFMYCTIKE